MNGLTLEELELVLSTLRTAVCFLSEGEERDILIKDAAPKLEIIIKKMESELISEASKN